MSWQIASVALVIVVLAGGFVWWERSRPPARIVAVVAALAALAVAGRIAFAPVPNVVATTDVVLLTGYALGPAPGFAVGALAGLISNFWLGQGPWTPWQMAGWGLIGIGGGALALIAVRRLGRWGLALAGAVAGLAYGAFLDLSVMVTYGGEQSLDRYFALSARGIPFNIAHAAGNAALMLAVGPALVRMLDRFQTRLEVDWQPLSPSTASSIALLAAGALAVGAGAPADANAAASVPDGAEYLTSAQNDDGGFGSASGEDSSAGMTGWAILGLESAGINPLDTVHGGNTPIDYLLANEADVGSTGDVERTILGLEAAGLDSHSFSGRDLVAELLERRRDDGSYQRQVNLSAYAVLALRAAGADSGEYGKTASWLRRVQNDDGGWGSFPGAPSEPDSTGAVLQALAVAPGSDPLAGGARWLRGAQLSGGGYALTPSAGANTQSTAWAVQGLAAAGVDPDSVRRGGRSPLDYLSARQADDGHFAYSEESDQTPVWVTAQALSASAQEPFPLAVVPREPKGEGRGGGDGGGVGPAVGAGSGQGSSGGIGPGARSPNGPAKEGRPDGKPDSKPGAPGPEPEATLADEPAPAGDTAALHGDSDSAPSTGTLLLILGAIALLLAAGWFAFRRRLP